MSIEEDKWTKFADRALDIIFVKYPARTALGVVLGGALLFVTKLFAPALEKMELVNFNKAPWWGWLAIGILIMHTASIISLFRQRPVGDDAIDRTIDVIERGNFSESERRQQYRELVQRVAKQIALNKTTEKHMSDIERRIGPGDPPSQSG